MGGIPTDASELRVLSLVGEGIRIYNQPHPMTTNQNKRVLSGMRPTGKLHLGNYMGALYNWLRLQHEYDCYFFIADFHALTTDYEDTTNLPEYIHEVAIDWLGAGLDPE